MRQKDIDALIKERYKQVPKNMRLGKYTSLFDSRFDDPKGNGRLWLLVYVRADGTFVKTNF